MIGLVVGGPIERACYQALCNRLGVSAEIRIPGRPGGEDRLLNLPKVTALCQALSTAHRLSKILVCVDSECDPNRQREQLATTVEPQLQDQVKVPVQYFFVECMLESWFLADRDALTAFLSPTRLPTATGAASRRDKQTLRRLVKQAKGDCVEAVHWPQITGLIHPDRLARASPNFADFRRLLRS